MSFSPVFHFLDRHVCSRSLSLSADETMIAVNNAHNGFNLYSIPNGAILEHLIEPGLCGAPGSIFMELDRFLVYPGNGGVVRVWGVKSKALAGSVHGAFVLPWLQQHARILMKRG